MVDWLKLRPKGSQPRICGRSFSQSTTCMRKGNTMDFGLAGKVAIVAAASKGLGRACATALAAEGAQVVIIQIVSSSVKQPIEGLLLSNAIRPGVVGLAKRFLSNWLPMGSPSTMFVQDGC